MKIYDKKSSTAIYVACVNWKTETQKQLLRVVLAMIYVLHQPLLLLLTEIS